LILGRYTSGQLHPRWLLALPPLMVFWVNVHGSFVLGLVLLAAFLAGEVLRRVRTPGDALDWRQLRILGLVALLVLLATLVNPRGLDIVSYVTGTIGNRVSQAVIAEWQPPSIISGLFFYASILLLLVALAHVARPPSPTDLLVLCIFLWLAWSGQRYIIWFSI